MFRILEVIAGNVLHGPGTIRLPGSVPCPPEFRGAVTHDPALCLACGICSYVCVGDAITAAEQDKNYLWTYEPGRCTFCARCVDHCPGHALTMAGVPVAAYFKPGQLGVQHLAPFPACSQCGGPSRPVNGQPSQKASISFGSITNILTAFQVSAVVTSHPESRCRS